MRSIVPSALSPVSPTAVSVRQDRLLTPQLFTTKGPIQPLIYLLPFDLVLNKKMRAHFTGHLRDIVCVRLCVNWMASLCHSVMLQLCDVVSGSGCGSV